MSDSPEAAPVSDDPTTINSPLGAERSSTPTPSNAGSEQGDHDEFEGRTTPEEALRHAWCLRYFRFPTVSTFVEGLSLPQWQDAIADYDVSHGR